MFDDESISELHESETSWDRIPMQKDSGDGVWRERTGEDEQRDMDMPSGFSGIQLRSDRENYESDRYNTPSHDDAYNAGWLGYHERASTEGRSASWLAGYNSAASSGRDPYAFTQERMRIDELKAELGELKAFLADVRVDLLLAGESQSSLARELGLPRQNVSRWFTGEVEPSLESMLRIRDAVRRLTEVEERVDAQ